ncbi:MAG: hypothetical protein ACLFPW_06160 [Spirochaetaceae bacterium]
MRVPSLRFSGACLFLLFFGTTVIGAQEAEGPTIEWSSSLDWSKGVLELTAVAPIEREGPNAPAAAHRAEEEIASELSSALVDALITLRIDSRRTIAEELREDSGLYDRLTALAEVATRKTTRPNRSLSSLEVTYALDLFPEVPRLLLEEDRPLPFPRILGWVASGSYTGVLIYAADPLPLHGTERTTTIEPALFPEIYDEAMGEVLTRQQLDPKLVARWGVAAYTDSLELSAFADRIGEHPKRIVARRLFGVTPTDLVISTRDARELLASENNRRLLREGRILIVTPPPTD